MLQRLITKVGCQRFKWSTIALRKKVLVVLSVGFAFQSFSSADQSPGWEAIRPGESVTENAFRVAREKSRIMGLESARNVQKIWAPMLSIASNALAEAPTASEPFKLIKSPGLNGVPGILSVMRSMSGRAAFAVANFPKTDPQISFAFYHESLRQVCQGAIGGVSTRSESPCFVRLQIDDQVTNLKITKYGPVIGGSVVELGETKELLRHMSSATLLRFEVTSVNGIDVYEFDLR